MKLNLKSRVGLIGALGLIGSPFLPAALITIGSGPDTSYFTLETPNVGLRQYAVRYDAASGGLRGGSALLQLIDAADPAISFEISDFGSPTQPNEFFSSLTFNGVTESNDFSPDGSTFTHWVAGGEAGAVGLGVPAPVPITPDAWELGAGLSVNFRLIAEGSNDALVFAPTELRPSVAPIPEPSSLLSPLLALLIFAGKRRR